jgi:putative peptide zinc metalloprotease protein
VARSAPLVSAAHADKGTDALAARYGAPGDRPALRKDLIIKRIVQLGEVTWVVKNPETLKFYNIEEGAWGLIQLFDGTRTREEIVETYNSLYPTLPPIGIETVLEYEEFLRKFELFEQSVVERNLYLLKKFKTARQRAAEEKAEGFNIFFLLFSVFDPNRFLDRTIKYVRWLWSPPAVAVSMVLFALTTAVFVGHFGPIWRETLELFALLKKPFWDAVQFFFIVTIILGFHELGHAYALKTFGGEVHDIGFALLYFTPALYTDTSDQYLLENKWHRLWVTTAGIYIEGLICAIATGLWVASYPDTLLHEIAYKTMLFTGISTLFFNANPLIKVDGYNALASIIEIPELREESFRYLGALFQRKILRLPVEVPVATRRKRLIYILYGVPALAYIGVIMAFISHLCNVIYSKYFPNLAVALLIPTLYYMFRKRVRLVFRVGKLFVLDKKEFLMSSRARTGIVAAAAVILVALAVPWARRSIASEVSLKPWSRMRLEAPEAGRVVRVGAREGDEVQKDQTILTLESPSLQLEGAALAAARERVRSKAAVYRELASASEFYQSTQRETAAAALVQSNATRQERLEVKSPVTGRVLTPRVQDLEGRFVAASTPLAEIGDCRNLLAEIPVSERLLTDIQVGAPVSLRLPGRPFRVFRGSIVRIAPATAAMPQTSTGSKEQLSPPELPDRFVAVAQFENADGSLLPGMAGRAKIYSQRASVLSRSWRVLYRWVRTLIW